MIQTLQRICALLAVADTELPFSWMALGACKSYVLIARGPQPICEPILGCARPASTSLPMPLLMVRIDVSGLKSKERRVTGAPLH